jgi:hypothetical protein
MEKTVKAFIEVVEGRTVNGKEIIVKAIIDEYEFIRLYGEQMTLKYSCITEK